MATDHVKVYEEKKGIPVWAWLLPLLLLLGLLAWYLLHRNTAPQTPVTTTPVTAPANGGTPAAANIPNLGSVHFATDQDTLTPEGMATLDRAADFLKANPNAKMRIDGYTDSTGTDPHNNDLSYRRALSAGHYLESKGIDKSRLGGQGFAAENPADTNATAAGKADNRRVELYMQQ